MKFFKFILIYVIIICVIGFYYVGSRNYDVDFENNIKKCELNENASCYKDILKKYKNKNKRERLILLYAKKLQDDENEYEKAKKYFNYLIEHSKNPDIIQQAKSELDHINNLQEKMLAIQKNDVGLYYNSQEAMRWKDSKNIKVYFASKNGKEYIFKKALQICNDTFDGVIRFVIVYSPKNADIEMRYVEHLEKPLWGYTSWKWKSSNNVKYLTEAKIQVALKNADGIYLSNENYLLTTLHELGHALGLPHSNSKNDIMFPHLNECYRKNDFSQRDINTLLKTYR